MRVAREILVLTISSGVMAAGCGELPSRDPSAAATVDTIGSVIHVSNPPPALEDTAVLLLSIGSGSSGGEPTAEEFGRIHSVTLDAMGNVFVADGIAREVRVFSPDGRFLRSFGRPGEGPGEFPALYSLAWIGEALLTLELGRISSFTPDGAFQRHWPWLPFTGRPDHVRFYPADQHEVYVLGLMPGGARGNSFIRFTAAGAQDTLRIPSQDSESPSALVCPVGGSLSIFSIPFAPRRIVTPAPDRLIAVAWSADYRIALTSSQGDTVRVIERRYPPVPITDAEWDVAGRDLSEFRSRNPGVRCDPPTYTRPTHRPPLQGLHFTHEGDMVVEVTTPLGTRYDYFDPDGVALETVVTPSRDTGVAPYFRAGVIVQVVRDSLDVQHVQVLRAAAR